MNITIQPDGKLKKILYKKPMTLYLFISPHSAHPPGVMTSHVLEKIPRFFWLNSDGEDIVQGIVTFLYRFLKRGHNCDVLKTLLQRSVINARQFLNVSNKENRTIQLQRAEAAMRRFYFHVYFHPQPPPLHKIKQIFNKTILNPPGKKTLNELNAGLGELVPIDAMIIANYRAKHPGQILSYWG